MRDHDIDPYDQDAISSGTVVAPQVSRLPAMEPTSDAPSRVPQGPRIRRTPRKSIYVPQRVTFENSQRVTGESS